MRNSKLLKALEKHFGIPNKPKALPMRRLTNNPPEEYCWEDFHKRAKETYPIRYFLFEELPIWLSVKYRVYIEDPIYWVRSYLIRKDHLLDLRGPVYFEDGNYRWGYLDPGHILERAIFASFNKYVEEINKRDGGIEKRLSFLRENNKEHSNDLWICHCLEVQTIDDFINKQYPNLIKELENLSKQRKHDEYNRFEKDMQYKVTDILIRIVKLREGMWT